MRHGPEGWQDQEPSDGPNQDPGPGREWSDRENRLEPEEPANGQLSREPGHQGGLPRRDLDQDRRPTWLEILLPILIILILATLALLWNIGAAIVVLIVGAGVILSWVIQRKEPHEPGE